jgi:hypothetical protein
MYNPVPSQNWSHTDQFDREQAVNLILSHRRLKGEDITLVSLRRRGDATVTYSGPIRDRARIILSLEKELRQELDNSLTVYLQPQGDINKLRAKLRGVSITNN